MENDYYRLKFELQKQPQLCILNLIRYIPQMPNLQTCESLKWR